MSGSNAAHDRLAVGEREDVPSRAENLEAGKRLAEIVRTTLGPNGLDKMLITDDGTVAITNDGASILERMTLSHPAATLVLEVAQGQDTTVGDGTTTAVVLAGGLLDEAESLLERGVSPAKITEGYHLAVSRAVETLSELTVSVDLENDERLRDIASTTVTGKWDESGTAFVADRAVKAVRAIERDGRVGFERLTRKTIPGGSFYDSAVIDGLVIDMGTSSTDVVSPEGALPNRYRDATVALIDEALSIDTPQGVGRVDLESYEEYERLREYERDVYEEYVDTVVGVGADVVFCQQAIDDPVRYRLAEEGVLAVERTQRDELHRLARATGGKPVPVGSLTRATTGTAASVERRSLGPTDVTVVSGLEELGQVSAVFRGGTQHVADETKRVLDTCFYALKLAVEDEAVVPGAGAIEVALARELRSFAAGRDGTEQLAVEAFADVLETVPRTLAETSGIRPTDALLELRTAHHDGNHTAGLDLETGSVVDAADQGVLEPLYVKRQALACAGEAASMIVRIDDAVPMATQVEDAGHDHDHDHGPGGLVRSTEGYPWAVGHSMGH
ncbi:thermosome subunit alpha [Natronococcus occultus]|uniref:Chaperonin GroEL n=1 Tax=Natronococcus occultus SP4 TaxID=694430 RepID=L0JVT9_9EURY|nr:molecular chaperone GroEL [Natronococcus occultus]AGB35978.1 chaperonin GroEL [Natronococcus occultus SP4]